MVPSPVERSERRRKISKKLIFLNQRDTFSDNFTAILYDVPHLRNDKKNYEKTTIFI